MYVNSAPAWRLESSVSPCLRVSVVNAVQQPPHGTETPAPVYSSTRRTRTHFPSNDSMTPMRKLSFALVLALAIPAATEAQAGLYPALQPTRVAEREYNFALADYTGGSALIAQWREGLGDQRLQFTGEFGIGDGPGDATLILGGSMHVQLTKATNELPFDMVLGAGIGVTTGNGASLLRIPVGVAIGHRFPLEGRYAITPFVHPRVSLNRVSAGNVSNTETDIDLDIGAGFELNEQMQIRLAAALGDGSGVGISFAWTPRGLRR